ncbi:MAG: hypothetical protein ABJC36_13550, partial [Gemmatimonadales bacterium]
MNRNFSQIAARTSDAISTRTPRARGAEHLGPWDLTRRVELAEGDRRRHAAVPDASRALDERDDTAEPAQHAVAAERRRQRVGRFDAVLQRDHKRVRAEHRAERIGSLRDLPGLHRDQHDVDLAQGCGIVARPDRMNDEVAGGARDLEAMLA